MAGEQIGSKVSQYIDPLIEGLPLNECNFRIYKGIVNYTAKQNYRADLRQEAVARASAIRQSHRPRKETPEKKLRGAKAKAAAEKES